MPQIMISDLWIFNLGREVRDGSMGTSGNRDRGQIVTLMYLKWIEIDL